MTLQDHEIKGSGDFTIPKPGIRLTEKQEEEHKQFQNALHLTLMQKAISVFFILKFSLFKAFLGVCT